MGSFNRDPDPNPYDVLHSVSTPASTVLSTLPTPQCMTNGREKKSGREPLARCASPFMIVSSFNPGSNRPSNVWTEHRTFPPVDNLLPHAVGRGLPPLPSPAALYFLKGETQNTRRYLWILPQAIDVQISTDCLFTCSSTLPRRMGQFSAFVLVSCLREIDKADDDHARAIQLFGISIAARRIQVHEITTTPAI